MIVRWSRRPVAPPSARAVAHRMPPLVVGSVAIGLAILRSPWWLFLLVPAGLSATPLGASARAGSVMGRLRSCGLWPGRA